MFSCHPPPTHNREPYDTLLYWFTSKKDGARREGRGLGEAGGPPGAAAGGRAGQVHEQRGHNQDGRAGEGWWREGVVRRREAGKARERSARKNAKRTARLGAAAAREGDEGAEFRRGEWGQ